MRGLVKQGKGTWRGIKFNYAVFEMHVQVIVARELDSTVLNEMRDAIRTHLSDYSDRAILFTDKFKPDPKES